MLLQGKTSNLMVSELCLSGWITGYGSWFPSTEEKVALGDEGFLRFFFPCYTEKDFYLQGNLHVNIWSSRI
jgi:hypothetical protein